MKNVLVLKGNIAIYTLLTLLFTVSVFSQAGLRRAMDVDADNKADFTIFRNTNNAWYTLKSGGGTSITQFGIASEDFMTPGDYDGDGKGDISIWRDTNGAWYYLRSSNSTVFGVIFGIPGDEPVARDYDGDLKTDPAVIRRTNGQMIWYVLGSTSGFTANQFGLAADYAAPGDYDGDLKYDYGIQRPGATGTSGAIFYISLSGSGGALSVIPWGFSNDLVVPGDYDADGKTDVAVVREGTTATAGLSWYIRKSSDGGLLGFVFGITGTDYTAQNDYDNDGKCDPTVWRDTNGTFYIAQSSTGYGTLTATQWGASGDYPVASYDTH
jgi:hypothetical protein